MAYLTAAHMVMILSLFFAVVLVVTISILIMLLTQTPYHASLNPHASVSATLKVPGVGTLDVADPPVNTASTQAIIILATKSTFAKAHLAASHLRRISNLPIELWYGGGDISNLPTFVDCIHDLQHMPDVTIHDIFHHAPAFRSIMANAPIHHLMVFALYLSTKQHVVCVAPHTTCVVDPQTLLQSSNYQKTGALFFPDFHNTFNVGVTDAMAWLHVQQPVHNYNCALDEIETGVWNEWCMDTSLFCFDRLRHWKAMHAMFILAVHHARMPLMSRGGKEIIWMAMEIAHDYQYTRAGWYAGSFAHPNCPRGTATVAHAQMLDGKVVFLTRALELMNTGWDKQPFVYTISSHTHRIKDVWDVPRFITDYMRTVWTEGRPCSVVSRPGTNIHLVDTSALHAIQLYWKMSKEHTYGPLSTRSTY